MKKGETRFIARNGVLVLQWFDSKVVTFVSTMSSPTKSYVTPAKSFKQEKTIPEVAQIYREGMGFVDRADQYMSYSKIGAFSKRWYVPIINFILDTAIHNAWVMYNTIQPIPQKEFRIKLANSLISNIRKKTKKEPNLGGLHLPSKIPSLSAKCSCGCGSNTPYFCTGCGSPLIPNCFVNFHKKILNEEEDEEEDEEYEGREEVEERQNKRRK